MFEARRSHMKHDVFMFGVWGSCPQHGALMSRIASWSLVSDALISSIYRLDVRSMAQSLETWRTYIWSLTLLSLIAVHFCLKHDALMPGLAPLCLECDTLVQSMAPLCVELGTLISSIAPQSLESGALSEHGALMRNMVPLCLEIGCPEHRNFIF